MGQRGMFQEKTVKDQAERIEEQWKKIQELQESLLSDTDL